MRLLSPEAVNQIANKIIVEELQHFEKEWSLTIAAVIYAKIVRATDMPSEVAVGMIRQAIEDTSARPQTPLILPGICKN